MTMGRIARQKYRSVPVAGGQTLQHPPFGRPARLVEPGGGAEGVDVFLECGARFADIRPVGFAKIADQHPVVGAWQLGYEQKVLLRDEVMDPIISVGKILYADIHHLKDVLLIVLALIANAQAFADATANAIGADHPARPRDLLRAV